MLPVVPSLYLHPATIASLGRLCTHLVNPGRAHLDLVSFQPHNVKPEHQRGDEAQDLVVGKVAPGTEIRPAPKGHVAQPALGRLDLVLVLRREPPRIEFFHAAAAAAAVAAVLGRLGVRCCRCPNRRRPVRDAGGHDDLHAALEQIRPAVGALLGRDLHVGVRRPPAYPLARQPERLADAVCQQGAARLELGRPDAHELLGICSSTRQRRQLHRGFQLRPQLGHQLRAEVDVGDGPEQRRDGVAGGAVHGGDLVRRKHGRAQPSLPQQRRAPLHHRRRALRLLPRRVVPRQRGVHAVPGATARGRQHARRRRAARQQQPAQAALKGPLVADQRQGVAGGGARAVGVAVAEQRLGRRHAHGVAQPDVEAVGGGGGARQGVEPRLQVRKGAALHAAQRLAAQHAGGLVHVARGQVGPAQHGHDARVDAEAGRHGARRVLVVLDGAGPHERVLQGRVEDGVAFRGAEVQGRDGLGRVRGAEALRVGRVAGRGAEDVADVGDPGLDLGRLARVQGGAAGGEVVQQQGRREDQQTARDEDDLRCGEFVSVVLYQRQQVGTEAVVGGGAGHDKGRACCTLRLVSLVQILEVALEVARQLHDRPEMVVLDHDPAVGVQLRLELGEGDGGLESWEFESVEPHGVAAVALELGDKGPPHLLAFFVFEGRVAQLHVDARDEGVVKGSDAVGGQEQNAAVELEGAEEAWICDALSEMACQRKKPRFSLGGEHLPATRLLRTRSCVERRSIKTSASSMSSTAPQLVAVLKFLSRFLSTWIGSVPMSLDVRTIKGRLTYSAMHSAVKVFPTPGLPCKRKIKPLPLPSTKSADH
ncbi:hypothetical protein PoMZ_00044 [Pyricularia oryzae]|uniref:Uncharacterized protein n=1 Tax=Pyricularia oryzae TaxID=318829 RepID=A0A4P7N197_PYROR|nr:hypothetical protein PoMZ_00044 [Pyricularia oryzae]